MGSNGPTYVLAVLVAYTHTMGIQNATGQLHEETGD